MTHFIKPDSGRFYVMSLDSFGNLYDSGHHFSTLAEADDFVHEMIEFDQTFDKEN